MLLVMALGRFLPDDLAWLRLVVLGSERASDRLLVDALCADELPGVPEVLCEARLIDLRESGGGVL